MSFSLIYPAIFVFLMMLIGVVMTIVEFNKSQKTEAELRKEEAAEKRRKSAQNPDH
ncbi:MAG: hypothetical protein R3296_00270 [Oleiphilaceae bacterium]|nr:hypothetical protein [Oleiphilaceae bacterium]